MLPYATALAHAQLRLQKHIQQQAGMHTPSKRVATLRQLNSGFLAEASKQQAYFQVGANVSYEDTFVIMLLQLLKERIEDIRFILANEALPSRVLEDYANEEKW